MPNNVTEFWKDMRSSIKMPSLITIGIMIVFPLLELFSNTFIGSPLSREASMYTILLTLIPFILGYKISNKIFENSEVLILLLLAFFIIFSGISLKSDNPTFSFALYWYILALGACILWIIIDFNAYVRTREKRKTFNENKNQSRNSNSGKSIDNMEVDEWNLKFLNLQMNSANITF